MKVLSFALTLALTVLVVAPLSQAIYNPADLVQNAMLTKGGTVRLDRRLAVARKNGALSESCEMIEKDLSVKCELIFIKDGANQIAIEKSEIFDFVSASQNTLGLKSNLGTQATLACYSRPKGTQDRWSSRPATPVRLNSCFNDDRARRNKARIFSKNLDEQTGGAYEYSEEKSPAAQ